MKHVVWTVGHHKNVEFTAPRLLDGIGGVLLDRLDIFRHFGRDDDEIDRVDVHATRLRRGRHAQQRIEVGVALEAAMNRGEDRSAAYEIFNATP